MANYSSQLTIDVETTGAGEASASLKNVAQSAAHADAASGGAAASAGRLTGAFKVQKGATQQLGYQMQDLAVQLQGGTSFMTAFSQQGSQMAGVFGPGGAVIGAIIAVGGALTGVLIKALGGASEWTERLSEHVNDLADDYKNLTAAQAEWLALQLQTELQEANEKLTETGQLIKDIQNLSWRNEDLLQAKADYDSLLQIIAGLEERQTKLNEVMDSGRAAADTGDAVQAAADKEAELQKMRIEAWKRHYQILADNRQADADEEARLQALRVQGLLSHHKIMADNAQAQADREAELRDYRVAAWEKHEQIMNDISRKKQQERAAVAGDMASAFGDLMQAEDKRLFEIGKIGSIGKAIMSTYEGVNKALAQGGIFGFAAAAAIGAAGFANVAKIAATQYGSKSSGGSANIPTPAAVTPQGGSGGQDISISVQGDFLSRDTFRRIIEGINEEVDNGMVINSIRVA